MTAGGSHTLMQRSTGVAIRSPKPSPPGKVARRSRDG